MKELPEKIIDFHVHLFPDRLFDAIWKYFSRNYQFEVIHQIYYRECIDYLREKGVGPIVYSNYAHRKGIADNLNEWNLRVLEAYPDVYCLAAYHPGIYLDTAYAFLPEEFENTFNLDPCYLEKYKDRILYGSDFPNLIAPRENEIDRLLRYDLSQDFYRKVFYENGMALINPHKEGQS